MVTEDMIRIIRENVRRARDKEREDMINARIAWSYRSAQKSWLYRLFWGGPSKCFTVEEAISSLANPQEDDLFPPLETVVNWVGWDVIKICDAIQTANSNGLPLRLTVAEVAELRKWL